VRSTSAGGNTQGTAAELTEPTAYVTTAPSAVGVRLPQQKNRGDFVEIYNSADSTDPLVIFPEVGAQILGTSGINVSVSLPVGSSTMFRHIAPGQWAQFTGMVPGLQNLGVWSLAATGTILATAAPITKNITQVYFSNPGVADGVLLPHSPPGATLFINYWNPGAVDSVKVYPPEAGGLIFYSGLSFGGPFLLAQGKSAMFICFNFIDFLVIGSA